MKENRLIMKWWFWAFIVLLSITGVFLIVSMTYALHPTEIHIFANKEMVATTEGMISIQRNQNFNDCFVKCEESNEISCRNGCLEYYSQYQEGRLIR